MTTPTQPADLLALVAEVMEKAQEFASSWALAGGRFDDGTMFETAGQRKSELRELVESLAAHRGEVVEVDENEVRQELAALVSAAGTQKRFSELMGVSESYVTDVLHGRRAVPGAWVIPSGYRMRWIKNAPHPPQAQAGAGDYRPHLDAIRSLVSPLQWETICDVFREQDGIIRAQRDKIAVLEAKP